MYKENKEALSGNDQFEGYNVDLVEHISKILNFDYEIRIVADGNYGSTDKDTGQWNGMIGELLTQVGLHTVCPKVPFKSKVPLFSAIWR